jgi:Na+-transporting methylmalonyl-CoA/oxaloacetate decarboxylase gamma subunit
MEKMSFIFFVIIVVYLLYSFIKTRFEKEDVKIPATEEKKAFSPEEKNSDEERAAIAAVIAALMGDASYVIKRVYAVATVDEKKSTWRYAGRNELMTAKNTLK